MERSTIFNRVNQRTKWAIFNSYVRNYQRELPTCWGINIQLYQLNFGASRVLGVWLQYIGSMFGNGFENLEGTPETKKSTGLFLGLGLNTESVYHSYWWLITDLLLNSNSNSTINSNNYKRNNKTHYTMYHVCIIWLVYWLPLNICGFTNWLKKGNQYLVGGLESFP